MTPPEPVRNAEELPATPLPCPFCDHDYPEFVDQGSGPPPMWAIVCGWCGAKGPGGLGFERGDVEGAKRAAVKELNRAPRPRPPTAHSDASALVDAVWIVGVVLGNETDPAERARLFDIKERLAAMAREDGQQHEAPPEVIEAFARDCCCCPCCRQCPCPGVMAGGTRQHAPIPEHFRNTLPQENHHERGHDLV